MFVTVVFDGPGDVDFFAVRGANIGVEILADGVLGEPIIDGFTVLLHLENVLAFRADVQRTFTAGQQAREGDGGAGIVRERRRRGDHPPQTDGEQDHDMFHIFDACIVL